MPQRVGVMQPQSLDVGRDQPHLLARGGHLRDRRQMVAGEDIFVGEGVRSRCLAELSDRVEQHDSIGLQQLAALGEELVVVRGADMLEHADRDDPVELLLDMAVVDQLELHLVGDAGRSGALASDLQLLLR